MADLLDRITVDAAQMNGRPCIRGMRITVTDILRMLASGMARADILRDYPYLVDDDIAASLAYAARQSDHPVIAAE